MKRNLQKRANSGQVLIITALVIALLILSVVYGVFEAGRISEMCSSKPLSSHILAVRLGLKHTVTSALVNASNGGDTSVLTANLNKYASMVGNQSFFGKCVVKFTVKEDSPYHSGIWLSWGVDGTGVSSAYANFTLAFTGLDTEFQMDYAVNVTTRLELDGTYTKLAGTNKQVNVTCRVYNNGEPALARSLTLYYERDGNPSTPEWTAADSPAVTDYGNGTYTISFTAETQNVDDPMLLSAHLIDTRGILVLANATCTEI